MLRDAYGDVIAGAVTAVRRGEIARVEGLADDQVAEAYRWIF